jgi:general secretion pathway protein D
LRERAGEREKISYRIACALLAACACWAAPLRAQEAAAEHAQPPASAADAMTGAIPAAGGKVTLDFANAEIDAVARTMATLTGRNVVVDPRVKGTITLTSTTPVTPAEAMRLFGSQLRTQGMALVDNDGITLVLPEAEAKLIGGAVSAGPAPGKGGGQILTQIFRLTHENANNLVPILRPLISPNNTINVSPGANALVITDYAENLQRMGRIVAALDVAPATGVEVVRLKYAVASDLTPLAARLLDAGSGPGASAPPVMTAGQPMVAAASAGSNEGGYKTTLVAEPRSNAIIIRAANPARVALAKVLIEQLDQPPQTQESGAQSNIHVVYLKNAEAAKLAVTLRAALAALPGQPQNGGAGAGGGSAPVAATPTPMPGAASSTGGGMSSLSSGPTINAAANNQPSTGGPIQADPATNSLIISAPEPVYRELRAVIDKLDQRRAQVYVESLIAEVRADREADFGVQWQALMKSGSPYGVIGTNFSTPSASPSPTSGAGTAPNIISFAGQIASMSQNGWQLPSTGLVSPSPGFNLLIGSGTFGALANFIQSSGAGNVLATPTVLTLDNEEAKIVVGQNLPFVTGSYTTNTTGTAGSAVGNPFQTYDRQDVGLTLRVRPQISEDGVIKLVLYQEVSEVASSSAAGPTTNKRAIESSVLVDDGAIVAIGGLLQDQYYSNEDKVPLLGDVPLLGNLFKSRSRSSVKTNLMVFLRPVIVRDAAATERYSLDRYEMMRAAQQGSQPAPSAILPINRAPAMPAVTPVRADVWTRPAPPPPLVEQPPSGDGNLYDKK